MSDADATWQRLAADYVRKVEKALSAVDHPRKEEVLADLRAHLHRRFEDLTSEERTPARLSALVEEMGPPEEYAELLAPEGRREALQVPWRKVWRVGRWVLVPVGLLVLFAAAVRPAVLLPLYVFGNLALLVAIGAVLAGHFRARREAGWLWLAAGLVLWPALGLLLTPVVTWQVDSMMEGRRALWVWPFIFVARGHMTMRSAFQVLAVLSRLVQCGLILVGLFKLRVAPAPERRDP
jgi:hypothetical protein